MAAGDVTIAREDVFGVTNVVFGTIAGGTYAAGGWAMLLFPKFGLTTVDHVDVKVEASATTMLQARYDKATNKLQIYESGIDAAPTPVEIGTDDLTSAVIDFVAYGRK